MIKIYLSSTGADLKDYRAHVYHILRQMREDVVAMEDYVAVDQPPLTKCLADVTEADIYVGLFAWRYGFIPMDENPEHKSITELEYRQAIAKGKPRFIFLLQENTPWLPSQMDSHTGEGENGKRIKELRDELLLKETVSFFQTPQELASLVSVAVGSWITEKGTREQQKKLEEKVQNLKTMISAEQQGLLDDRLDRFVGREKEISELQALIWERQRTGGYVIVTGLAGQGKSSLIAKMIANQGKDTTAYHFIQFGSGHDYQFSLLRDLMAHLILKHDLPERYVAGASYPILRDYFFRVLNDIAEKGKHEVIYIDGIDQLEMDLSASLDLSFLPSRLPPGIVIVLGTRPNKTLELVQLRTGSSNPYELPGFSREDFNLLLQHHEVRLSSTLGDSLYQRLNQSPLYLDLVARELRERHSLKPQELIARIANNPDDIFTITFSRIQQLPEWYEVTRRILGTLLVAQEPLTSQQIAHIWRQDNARVRAGIRRLGGLLTTINNERFRLFHPKLNEYLKQVAQAPANEIQFDAEEIELLHGQLVQWCEQGSLDQIWLDLPNPSARDDYREYAQKHYITHLYDARMDERLFAVLNDGSYEQGKLDFDPSTSASAADLMLGCRAAAREAATLVKGEELVTYLWRYTLLRTSLITQADAYPLEAFQALLAQGRERDALNLAELLTQPGSKVAVLILLTEYLLKQPSREAEGIQLYIRAYEIAASIEDEDTQTKVLSDLTEALIRSEQLARAESVARSIASNEQKAKALCNVSEAYGRQNNWMQAEEIARSIITTGKRISALGNLAAKLKLAQEQERAESLWQEISATASTITDDDQRSDNIYYLSVSFTQAKEWGRAEKAAQSIVSYDKKVSALCQLALSLQQEGLASQAETMWEEAQAIAGNTRETDKRDQAYKIYAISKAQASFYDEAEIIARRRIESPTEKINVLSSLVATLVKEGLWEPSKRIIDLIVNEYNLIDVDFSVLDNILVFLSLDLAKGGQWQQARKTVRSIPRKEVQGRAFMGIVSVLAQVGEREKSQIDWEEARAMCIVRTDAVQSEVTGILVSALVEVGRTEQARTIISTLPDKQTQEYVMEKFAIALARGGQIPEAETIASEITNLQRKASIQESIAIAQMQAKQPERAIETAHSISQEKQQSHTLSELVTICCQRQQWDIAQEIARQIQSGQSQAEAMSRIIDGLVRAGRIKEAEAVTRSIGNEFFRANVTCNLATILAQAGYLKDADRLARSIRKNQRIQQKAFSNISIVGLLGATVAEPIARAIDAGSEREEALCNIATAYAHEKSWDEAEKIAREISDRQKQDEAWGAIAKERAKVEQWLQAIAALDKIQKGDQRIEVLQVWGELLVQPSSKATREQIVQHLNRSKEKARLLVSIADTLAKADRYLEQIRLVQQAWLQASKKEDCEHLFALIQALLPHNPELCTVFYESFGWVDTFLGK